MSREAEEGQSFWKLFYLGENDLSGGETGVSKKAIVSSKTVPEDLEQI